MFLSVRVSTAGDDGENVGSLRVKVPPGQANIRFHNHPLLFIQSIQRSIHRSGDVGLIRPKP